MKLTFKRGKNLCYTTEQVYPVVAETGEEIEDVLECIVNSGGGSNPCESLTTMTITVSIHMDKKIEAKK